MEVGVIIGRFQVDTLTPGHYELINYVRKRHRSVVVFVGESPTKPTKRNPMPAYLRIPMIREAIPDAVILPLMDARSDVVWSHRIDAALEAVYPACKAVLYGGRDSFIPHYHGRHQTHDVPSTGDTSGTAVRDQIANGWENHGLFRRGVIHAATMWDVGTVYPTVDIAVMKGDMLLAVRKPGEDLWRFPGGFVSPSDESLATAAARELHEETGVVLEGELKYVSSRKVNDWRTRGTDNVGVMTTLFTGAFSWGSPVAADDVADWQWVALHGACGGFVEEHKPLVDDLLDYLEL